MRDKEISQLWGGPNLVLMEGMTEWKESDRTWRIEAASRRARVLYEMFG